MPNRSTDMEHSGMELTTGAQIAQTHDPSSPPISDSFRCGICLDLVFKPVVHGCGHVFCFWCVHRSMSSISKSQCPICRQPYSHFPRVCELLHILLSKIFPEEYREREIEIRASEEESRIFSPQLDYSPQFAHRIERQGLEGNNEESSSEDQVADGDNFFLDNKKGVAYLVPECSSSSRPMVLCHNCRQMLCHPVGLNCGHVFCRGCLPNAISGNIICAVCASPHPGSVQVCLVLDHYIESTFPKEYAKRLEQILSSTQVTDVKLEQEASKAKNGETSEINNGYLHVGVGCDACGMLPIRGQRFRCQECKEIIGYDLCGECYKSGFGIPGRFNQQHTREHVMLEIKPNSEQDGFHIIEGDDFQAVELNSAYNENDPLFSVTQYMSLAMSGEPGIRIISINDPSLDTVDSSSSSPVSDTSADDGNQDSAEQDGGVLQPHFDM